MKWEQNIQGFIPQTDWLNIGFNVTRPGDPIDGLFGDQRTDNLVAQWQTIASEYQIPVSSTVSILRLKRLSEFRWILTTLKRA